jgi:hypothetical protein
MARPTRADATMLLQIAQLAAQLGVGAASGSGTLAL